MTSFNSTSTPKTLSPRAFMSLLFGVLLGMPLSMHVLARFAA